MARYTQEFKYTIIRRMMPPNNESAEAISRESGIPEGTLHSVPFTHRPSMSAAHKCMSHQSYN